MREGSPPAVAANAPEGAGGGAGAHTGPCAALFAAEVARVTPQLRQAAAVRVRAAVQHHGHGELVADAPRDGVRRLHIAPAAGVTARFRRVSACPARRAAERRHRAGRERKTSPTLQTLQDPIFLTP
jgi:hypothetical protein